MFNTKIKNILIGTILILLFLITPTYAAKIETEITLSRRNYRR